MLAELSESDKASMAVKHALEVRRACVLGNYHRLGRLYREAPGEGRRIMRHFMGQARVRAMQVMLKAYKSTLPSGWVEGELGFGGREGGIKEGEGGEEEEEEARVFLERVGWVVVGKGGGEGEVSWDMKASKVDPAAAVTRTLM